MMNSYVLYNMSFGIWEEGGAFQYFGLHVMFCQKQGYVVRAKLGKSTQSRTQKSPLLFPAKC